MIKKRKTSHVTGLNPTETEIADLIHNVDANEDGKIGGRIFFILI